MLLGGWLILADAVPAATCDTDADGDIDRNDIFAIEMRRAAPAASPADPRDADADGYIGIADERLCLARCSLPRCLVFEAGNRVPLVDAGPSVAISEGELFFGAGSFTDQDDERWDGSVDYGAGEGRQPLRLDPDRSFVLENTYFENGDYRVSVNVRDASAGIGRDLLTVTVKNRAPAVSAGPDAILEAGESYLGAGYFDDPGLDNWSASVDYGEGDGAMPLALNPDRSFLLDHSYQTPGNFVIVVTVVDDDGGIGSANVEVSVVAKRAASAMPAGGLAAVRAGVDSVSR